MQPVAPFPGPDRPEVVSPSDSVFSHQDSASSGGRSPSPNEEGHRKISSSDAVPPTIEEVEVEITDNSRQNGNGDHINGNVTWNENEDLSMTTAREKVKEFRASLSSLGNHFSSVLISEDGDEVLASAQ